MLVVTTHNIIKRPSIHAEQKYHKDAIKDSHNLINRFEKPEGTITTTQIPFTVRGIINIKKF